jgi:oligopeptidase B
MVEDKIYLVVFFSPEDCFIYTLCLPHIALSTHCVFLIMLVRHVMILKDISNGQEIIEPIRMTDGDVVWAADNRHIFYVTKDHQERPNKVWRYSLCGSSEDAQGKKVEAVLVYEEQDEAFFVGISKSRSEKIIFISCGEKVM